MNARLPLLAAALVSLLLSSPASAGTITIWHETFDSIGDSTTKWDSDGTSLSHADVSGWSTVSGKVYTGQKGVRVGAARTAASLKSPAITPNNLVNGITVTVNAAAYHNVAGTQYMKVEVQDAAGASLVTFGGSSTANGLDGTLTQHISVDAVEIPITEPYFKSFTIPSSAFPATGNMFLVFSCDSTNPSAQNRLLLGDVLVTQRSDSGLTVLDSPVLSVSDVGFFDFTLSWDPVSGANNGYAVTMTPAIGNISVNGRTATVEGLAEGATYRISVVANGNGTTTDDSDATTISVTTATAPAISTPDPIATAVSASSVTVSWTSQNDASFSVRAWTLNPVDEVSENFAGYAETKTPPEGWTFNNSGNPYSSYTYTATPVDFRAAGNRIETPVFGGPVTNVSFRIRRASGAVTGSFVVYGTTDNSNPSNWIELKRYTDNAIVNGTYVIPVDKTAGVCCLAFECDQTSGGLCFGSFTVQGTGVGKKRSYLTGYGSDEAGVPVAGTSVTISNPVAGETNYIEVTATGLSGRTATITLPVFVPGYPSVISVK